MANTFIILFILCFSLFFSQVSSLIIKSTSVIWLGDWGNWMGMKNASEGYFACGGYMKMEPLYTGANGLILQMCRGDNWDTQYELLVLDGDFGAWETPAKMCELGSYIVGGSVRY